MGRELVIEYYTPSRDEVSERTVVPRHVFVDGGSWYALADDGASGGRRTFRIDRIETVRATVRLVGSDELVEAPNSSSSTPTCRERYCGSSRPARWVVEEYPVDEVKERRNGQVEVRLPVSSDRWLAKLLIRSGPNAVLVEPAGWTAARTGRGDARSLRRDVERRELLGVDDAVCPQEVGEHGGCGQRITERVVRSLERDAVAGADVCETMRLLAFGIEPTRHSQRTEGWVETAPERVGRRSVATCPVEETRIERGIVRGEQGPVESSAEFVEGVGEGRRPAQGLTGDAVDLGRPDSLQWPTKLDEGRPLVEHGAVRLHDDETDLEHAVSTHGQPGGLQVDDGECGQWHARHPRHGVSQPVLLRRPACPSGSGPQAGSGGGGRGGSAGSVLEAGPDADGCRHGESGEMAVLLGLAGPVPVLAIASGRIHGSGDSPDTLRRARFAFASRRSRACGRSALGGKNSLVRPLHTARSCQLWVGESSNAYSSAIAMAVPFVLIATGVVDDDPVTQ